MVLDTLDCDMKLHVLKISVVLAVLAAALLAPPVKIVANLPYNVGTELLTRWLDAPAWPPFWDSLTLMFQREVAERIVAKPGGKAYGRLAILAQWRADPHVVMELPPEAFSPAPKVHSAVVHLTALPEPRPDCLVHLTLGTGVGSGIIIRGRPWRGSCGFAAELAVLEKVVVLLDAGREAEAEKVLAERNESVGASADDIAEALELTASGSPAGRDGASSLRGRSER